MVVNHLIRREVSYTLAQSRAMRVEYPVGNWDRGPATGAKEGDVFTAIMDVVAIVAAIPSGGASLTLLAGLSIASAAISLVGVVTGNQLLSTLGAVGGMATGLMNLASGASLGGDIGNGLDSAGNAIPNLDGSMSSSGIINTADAGQNSVGGYSPGANGGYGTAAQQAPDFGSANPSAVGADGSISLSAANPVSASNGLGGMQPITPTTQAGPADSLGSANNSATVNTGNSTSATNTDMGAGSLTGNNGSTGIIGDAYNGVKNAVGTAWDKFSSLSPETQKLISGGLQQAFPSSQVQAQTANELSKAGFTDMQTQQLKQQMANANYAGGAGGLTAAPTGIIGGVRTA